MNDIFSRAIAMPLAVQGMVATTPEGDYQIIINAAYSLEKQREIFNHEMRHILLGHYQQQTRSLAAQEWEANDKQLLLEKIKEAERTGLPLINGLLRGLEEPPASPAVVPQHKPSTQVAQQSGEGAVNLEDILLSLQALETELDAIRSEHSRRVMEYRQAAF